MLNRKDSSKSKFRKVTESYTVKNDGTVTLDLAKAAKSDTFKESIRRIRQQDLIVKVPG